MRWIDRRLAGVLAGVMAGVMGSVSSETAIAGWGLCGPTAGSGAVYGGPAPVFVTGGRIGGIGFAGYLNGRATFARYGRSGFPVSVVYVASPTRTVVWPPQPPPPVVPATPPEPPTLAERAAATLAEGGTSEAVALYRELHEKETEAGEPSAETLRLLGLALLAAERIDEGAAVLRSAYASDQSLAGRRMPEGVLGSGRRVRGVIRLVAKRAHELDSASLWLAAAVLMQLDRRPDAAENMVDRSAGRGLEPEIADAMRASLEADRRAG